MEGKAAHCLEMAVFQRSGGTYGGRRSGLTVRVLKGLFVAVLLSTAGVVAMCSFDEGFRRKVIDIGQQLKARVSAAGGGAAAPIVQPAEVEPGQLSAEKAKVRGWELWTVGV